VRFINCRLRGLSRKLENAENPVIFVDVERQDLLCYRLTPQIAGLTINC